jgi:anthranilate phosphoribosyltransferase
MSTESIRPNQPAELEMAGYLARIATGPRLSKDLGRDEARAAMELILDGKVPEAQAAAFLVALRMKRESHDELCGVLDALRSRAEQIQADVGDLVDMAEPYNGYVRHLPAAAFMPAVLAACDLPCVLHGCPDAGPKWGLTPHRVLRAAGTRVDFTPAAAAAQIAGTGWTYLDLSMFCAPLARLARLRALIVKRPCLSLLEKMIAPLRAAQRTHLWIGYAHREYPEILADLAREFGFASMLAVRGVEGGVLTSLSGRVRGARFMNGGALEAIEIAATEAVSGADMRAPELPSNANAQASPGTHTGTPGVDIPGTEVIEAWAEAAARAGRAALAGEPGPTANMLILGAAAVLRHVGKAENLAEGAAKAQSALQSGAALERFDALCT